MASRKLAPLLILCCCVLLPVMAGAQNGPHYTTTTTQPSISDATSDCLVGHNQCWVSISSSTPTIQQLSVGADGSTFGLDANGNIWQLPFNSHTWQSRAYSPMQEISVVSDSNIYGLQADTSFCGLPELRIYQYTGGTDFAKVSYCALHIGAGADGTLYRIRSSGNVTHLVNGTWISDPSAGGNGTPVKLAVGNQFNVWLITSTGVIKTLDYSNTGNFVVVSGWASDIATAGDPNNSTETTYVVGTTQNSANVYKYSSSGGALNGTWTELNGVLTKIATGGWPFTVGVQYPSSAVYHLNNAFVILKAQTTGYYDCNVFPNGCPVGSTHTASITVSFGAGGHGGSAQQSGAPATNLNAQIFPWTEGCDPIFGDPSSPECQVNVNGNVNCSKMGSIFGSLKNIRFQYEFAKTRIVQNGGIYNCSWGPTHKVEYCDIPVASWCTPATTPPDYNPPSIHDVEFPISWQSWDAEAFCWRLSFSGTSLGLWQCSPGLAIELTPDGAPLPPKRSCTYNP